ncbi:HAD family phosphatase [Solirubrobacter phytolaccae]|uniref:HAD family phosphatase n=1 Tax=Solirubrobacter phytolaccae TaxID=1404360 RepID=A0A9X3NG06_9ACTN|nr:HAD family phosphatase [Solirubrobacter phytolaccae]MDA0183356.1 HAD family phosphatase [Solirubrobacter phytolaccae]
MIFDCDGTLVDSEPLSGESWRRTLAPYGYTVTDADLEACLGTTYKRTHAFMAERVAIPAAETLQRELHATLFGLYATHLKPFADALEAVAELRAAGVPMAVASSSVRERLDHTLASVGLEFGITIAGDEVSRGKPAPDMFLLAAERLGIEPKRCVVVEDSGPGVRAGRSAGMPTLGVCRVPGTEASLAVADRVVNIISASEILALAAL